MRVISILAEAVRYAPPVFAGPSVPPVIISMPAPAKHADIVASLYTFANGAAVDCDLGYIMSDGRFMTVAEHEQFARVWLPQTAQGIAA